MFDLPKFFKEINPESSHADKWRDIVFNTGNFLHLISLISLLLYKWLAL